MIFHSTTFRKSSPNARYTSGVAAFVLMAIAILASAPSASASASNLYIGQNAIGAGNGADCGNTLAYTFFNNSGNWGSGGSQIGPGTTVHICGTITGSGGANLLTFHGNGSSGNPVTLKFESGAKLQAPYWGTTGSILANGNNYVTIDGGTNGIVQATSNGSSLGNQVGGDALHFEGTSNLTVTNVLVLNTYVHTGSGEDGGDTGGIGVTGGSNVTITGNTITNVRYGVFYGYSGSISNVTISNNTFSRCEACMAIGSTSGGDNITNLTISGNDVSDSYVWNDANYGFHHDNIHIWATSGNNNLTNVQIFNNYFHGDFGNGTSMTYIEETGGTASVSIYNNVYAPTAATNATGGAGTWLQTNGSSTGNGVINLKLLNNTYKSAGVMTAIWLQGSNIAADIRQNIVNNWGTLFVTNGASLPQTMDYNDWNGASGGSGWWSNNNSQYSTLSSWRSASGLDGHSSSTAPNLDSNYKPQSGSPAIGLGLTLASMLGSMPALAKDKGGITRPTVGAWDVGAYQSGSTSASLPSAPTGLTLTVQ